MKTSIPHYQLHLLSTFVFGSLFFAPTSYGTESNKAQAVPIATPMPSSGSRIEWNEPKSALPTMPAPLNWQIETYRDLRYKHTHTLQDGTVILIDVVPFILTPANPKMVYFLEPGYNPKTGRNHNLGESVNSLNQAIDQTENDMKAISTQLEKLRKFLLSD
jgi:hypothetical protein